MAAVASAAVAMWPAGAAQQRGAGIGHKATSNANKHVAAAEQTSGQPLVFKPGFIAHQDQRLALEAQRAAAAQRARRQAARRRAAARAAARAAERAAAQRAAVQRAAAQRAADRRAARAARAPAQPSGSPQQIAMAMLGSYGWSSSEFGCLNDLWTRESGWNPAAANPSGAFGIPQALPGSKMASAGADWQTNPATQIRWGLGYIRDIYGSPCGAWDHELATGSY